jgi:outer membrane protein insertion porin family
VNLITTTKNYIENKYKKDGYYNTKVNINIVKDTATINQVNMLVSIDKGDKVKIQKNRFYWKYKAVRQNFEQSNERYKQKIFFES